MQPPPPPPHTHTTTQTLADHKPLDLNLWPCPHFALTALNMMLATDTFISFGEAAKSSIPELAESAMCGTHAIPSTYCQFAVHLLIFTVGRWQASHAMQAGLALTIPEFDFRVHKSASGKVPIAAYKKRAFVSTHWTSSIVTKALQAHHQSSPS